MSIEDQAVHVLEQRCRYCGAQPGDYHDRHCNVILSQRIEDLVANLTYTLNDVARRVEVVVKDIQSVGVIISQNGSYNLFMRHVP